MNQQNNNSGMVGLLILATIIFLLAAIMVTFFIKYNSDSDFSFTIDRRSIAESKDLFVSVDEVAQLLSGVVEAEVKESDESGIYGADIETEEVPSEPVILEVVQKPDSFFKYIEVTDGCGIHFEGDCLNVRSGPGIDYPVVSQLRSGIVLKVDKIIEVDGERWYKIIFDEWLRYPERVKGGWYVYADYVKELYDEGEMSIEDYPDLPESDKSILVDRSEQKLYAYDDDEVFMETSISTGLALTPTPRGTFTIYRKTPSRYMQGPLSYLNDKSYYDLPGVPWNLYFTEGGAVIHGAYWHDSFGSQYSHGCVNLPAKEAYELYEWADLGMTVTVRD